MGFGYSAIGTLGSDVFWHFGNTPHSAGINTNHAHPVVAHSGLTCLRSLNSDPAFGNSTYEKVYVGQIYCENASKLFANGTEPK